jgi:FtsP/CotA-like multicopper oxidase with cupredoxin domain
MSARNLIKFLVGSGIVLAILIIFAASKDLISTSIAEAEYHPQVRTYYLAAEKVKWNYAPSGKDLSTGQPVPQPYGQQLTYDKVRYIEYTDATFTKKKPQPQWLGILGPIIRGVPGDTIKIVFYNKADKPYSIHPHGVQYDKANEGAMMMSDGDTDEVHEHEGTDMDMDMDHDEDMDADDAITPEPVTIDNHGVSGAEVKPGQKFTYVWHVRPEAAPKPGEGGSKVWLYHSHVTADDIYDGLIGPIIITSRQYARSDATPTDVSQEFVTLFMIFDESKEGMTDEEAEGSMKHSINGYIFSNLQGLTMKKGERVRWHVIGLGNEVDLHTPHWHGNVVTEPNGHITDVIELLPASMESVEMTPDNPGTWMFHCHVTDHMEAGMMTTYTVL